MALPTRLGKRHHPLPKGTVFCDSSPGVEVSTSTVVLNFPGCSS